MKLEIGNLKLKTRMNFSAASSGVFDITDGLTRRLNTIAPKGGELTQQD